MKTFFISSLLIAGLFFSCKPKFDTEISEGEADFSKTVFIGGSNLSGYTNDALNIEGQTNSVSFLLSEQFKKANGSEFIQGLINESSVGLNLSNQAALRFDFKTDCKGVSSLSPIRSASVGDGSIFNQTFSNVNAFVSPFMRTIDAINSGLGDGSLGSGNYDPFYKRIQGATNKSPKQQIIDSKPTFTVVSLGEEDLLRYAQSGGTKSLTPLSGPEGVGFETSLNAVLTAAKNQGSKGVVQTLPDVTAMPYFNTIPWDNLILSSSQADLLNNIYGPLGFTVSEGRNGFIIEEVIGGIITYRKLVAGEKVLLSVPLDSIKCYGYGSQIPLANRFILTIDEINELNSTRILYNNSIGNAASNHGFALADAAGLYDRVNIGFTLNGVNFNSKFVTGNFYSLDGRYLCPKGQALLTNEYIKAINYKYKSSIPFVVPSAYNSITFP